jgi:hypothetical protein
MVVLWDLISLVRAVVREWKFGNITVPPQPTPKDKFVPKPNQLLKLKEKTSEKASEKPSEKPSEEPCEEPHPKPKPRPICFHCEFCETDGHKREFCYKRREGKGVVHTVPAWRDKRALGGGKFAGREPLARQSE